MATIYILQSKLTGLMKVGIAENLGSRLATYQTHNAEKLEVWLSFDGGRWENAKRVERDILNRFKDLVDHGEWVNPTEGFLRAAKVFPEFYAHPLVEGSEYHTRSRGKFICLRCGSHFTSGKEKPKRCGVCGTSLWDQERVRAAGGGRPKVVKESRGGDSGVKAGGGTGERAGRRVGDPLKAAMKKIRGGREDIVEDDPEVDWGA
jgi:hypothetical protein